MKHERIWELDALRGIAILLMAVFHIVYDLEIFFGYECFGHMKGFWFYEGRIAAILFIVLVGVVSSIIGHRFPEHKAAIKNAKRGLRLIGLGLIITIASYILDSASTIWFGILHFLGLSVLISIPLVKYKKLNLLLGGILMALYYQTSRIYTTSYLGIIFGIYPSNFQSFDHYALIPWLGYVLIGIALGNWIYGSGKKIIKRKPTGLENALAATGKYSLWIYLIHQPVLLTFMWLIFR